MKFIGAHVSCGGGVENAPLNASAIQAKAFALFTKNQRLSQILSKNNCSCPKFFAILQILRLYCTTVPKPSPVTALNIESSPSKPKA